MRRQQRAIQVPSRRARTQVRIPSTPLPLVALTHRTSAQSHMDAVVEGSVARLRPKLMTVATTVLGLLPIMFASGSGMDITKPIAVPTFGGMITSTVYVLFLIPCLFAIGEDIRTQWPERFGAPRPAGVAGGQ